MNVLQELADRGCVYASGKLGVPDCQFIGTSGAHLQGYFNFDPAMPDIAFLDELAALLAKPFAGKNVGAIVYPAVGSIQLGALVALKLSQMEGTSVAGIWADKVKDEHDQLQGFAFERPGFLPTLQKVIAEGKGIGIVDDMINRQYTMGLILEAVRSAGGEVVGVSTVAANRDVTAESLGVSELTILCEIAYDTMKPEACEQSGWCAKGIPIVVNDGLGHGSDFQKIHPDYKGGFIELPPPAGRRG
jgi:adenine/guanine phosphoribosyltransferase-like PRPP-binding protein